MTEQRIATAAMILALATGLLGCAPRVRVISNPGPEDQGIRYYRPKPYLKVVPAEVQFDRDASKIETNLVTVTLEYLPDFSEEYAIDVRPGLGVADVGIKLENGWNLTEISQELDSQTDENISAAGDLIDAITGFVPTASSEPETVPRFTVPATDVPLGYYESVISRGPDGRKRLYGFRYLGFLPYQTCPTSMGGSERYCCNDPMAPLYGLTFEGGRMVFRPLASMQVTDQPHPDGTNAVATAQADTTLPLLSGLESAAIDLTSVDQRNSLAARLEIELLGLLGRAFPDVQRVVVGWAAADEGTPVLRTEVFVVDLRSAPAVRQTAIDALSRVAQGRFLYDVRVQQ